MGHDIVVRDRVKLIGGDTRCDCRASRLDGSSCNFPRSTDEFDFLDRVDVIALVFPGRLSSHVLRCNDRGGHEPLRPQNPWSQISSSVSRHMPSLNRGSEMADQDQWWYNHKTREVEQGRQSLGLHRDGPFATREEALRAPEIARERSQAWEDDEQKS